MLHELLLALTGCDGDIIIAKQDGFYLDQDLPFLHESEKEMMDELCKLGFYYRSITTFVQENGIQQHVLALNYDREPPSAYARALCSGLDEILDAYMNSLTQIEQKVLNDPVMPLSYLKQALRDYEVLFPHLHNLVTRITSENLRGGLLLDFLHNKTFSGIPVVKNAMTRLIFHCNVAMLRHLSTWIVYGVLPEVKFSEFFIGEEKDPNERQSQSTADEKKKYLSTWNQQFKIQSDMLPPYLSLHLAEKILFIGKSIKVLQQISRYDRKGSTQSIPQSELMQYAESIRVHEQSSKLHIVSFELTIDRIRTSVSKYLWNLIVVDSDLFGHLEAFKHYFLLSRGDLYQSFIEDSRVLMSLMPPQHAGQDIKFLYKQAAKKSTAENDPHFERVKISLVPRRNTTTTDIMEVWAEVMKLDYDVQWPLHLLFTQDTIEKYDKIFKFLFLIKRVQFEVQNAWHPLVHRKKPETQTKEVTMLLLLRARMSFLIENLQFYLHADVLDVQYEILTKRINDTKDFEVALRAHEDYLKKITSQCFLNKKQIQVLKKLFDMIMQLCALVTTEFAVDKEDRQEEEQPNLSETIQELTREYDRQANLLFQILSGQKVLSPHLAQLLVRLDYNKFFSQSIKEEMSDE